MSPGQEELCRKEFERDKFIEVLRKDNEGRYLDYFTHCSFDGWRDCWEFFRAQQEALFEVNKKWPY